MIERDLTAQDGIIAKELAGTGWHWKRIPDMASRQRHTVGFDGLLCRPPYTAIRCEVKVGDGKLTESEADEADACVKRGELYIVLTWQGEGLWWLWPMGHDTVCGTLAECMAQLGKITGG